MWLLRRRIDLARSGAWSAAIRHAPRALGGAVVTKGRAQLIKETFCVGVILALARTLLAPSPRTTLLGRPFGRVEGAIRHRQDDLLGAGQRWRGLGIPVNT